MADKCEIYCYDERKVRQLKEAIRGIHTEKTAMLFKVLSDETRLRILHILRIGEEVCVCDVVNVIGGTVANVSHHLRLLKNQGIARARKEGKLVFYSLQDDQIRRFLSTTFEPGVLPEQEVSRYV